MITPSHGLKLGGGGGGRNPAARALAALTLIAAIAALILHAAIPAGAQSTTDYDTDGDGLIEIRTIAQLHGIRYDGNGSGNIVINPPLLSASDLAAYNAAFPNRDTGSTTRMGCPMGACTGYELMDNLDFATATTSLRTWDNTIYDYRGILEGNGYTISNLRVTSTGSIGLFTTLDTSGVIRNVGLINPTIVGRQGTGGLAGSNRGSIVASYVSGGVISANGTASMGGLAGQNDGAIIASYANVSVSAGGYNGDFGGLVGRNRSSITASYAIGAVTGTGAFTDIGGLAGQAIHASSAITDSYCGDATGQANCIGNPASSAGRYAAAQLQTPTTYTGIYANWNVDLNSDNTPDNPWNFGATSTYPVLYTPAQRQTAVIDYDADNDNLIDIDTLHKLNAIRWDLDGNGVPDAAANTTTYAAAFPSGNIADTSTPYMGCAATCTGYELTANINFAADGAAVTSTDPYPNWTPIGPAYAATFDGKGNTINHLTITGATGNSGLFNTLTTGAVIRDVGMVAASIGNNGANAYVGVLAGDNDGGMIITSYASGGAVTVTGTSTYGGGLIGRNAGDVRAVYSTASVTASSTATTTAASPTIGGLIGLHAGSITASYAAGTTTGSAAAIVGGFAGQASSTAAAITNGYCDTTVNGTSTPCVAAHAAGATATSTGYTTTQLQTPTDYTGIYESWNIPLGADNMLDDPWSFGTSSQYPTIKAIAQRVSTTPPPPPIPPPPLDPTPTPTSTPATSTDPLPGGGNGDGETATSTDPLPGDAGNGGSATSTPPSTPEPTPAPTPAPTDSGNGRTGTSTDTLPPPLPRTIPPEPEREREYNPAADHPEIYNNAEYEMAATCQTHNIDPETGNPQSATVTFDLGSYTGPILLHLSIWANGRYMAYETQGLASPALERNGQRATLRVDTDPAQTRFRLDGRRHGLAANLLLGYANCDTDDP